MSAYFCIRLFGPGILFGIIDPRTLIHILKKSSYTCIHDLVRVLVTRLDTFAVGYFFSTSTVGLYGMAQQFLIIIEKSQ